jgi:hypothetical protein
VADPWRHDDLAADLAVHLCAEDRMVWQDLQLGPSGSIRPDVYTLQKSYTGPAPVAYECKISRSDFLADVTSGKWMNYLQVATAVYFAVPHGLIKRDEVPKGCGLYVRSERGWAALKRATRQPCSLDADLLLKLLIDGLDLYHGTTWRGRRSRLRQQYVDARYSAAKVGARIAKIVEDQDAAERAVRDLEKDGERRRQKLDSEIAEARRYGLRDVEAFCKEIGFDLPDERSCWAFGRELRERLEALADRPRLERARRAVERARSEIETALASIGPREKQSEVA